MSGFGDTQPLSKPLSNGSFGRKADSILSGENRQILTLNGHSPRVSKTEYSATSAAQTATLHGSLGTFS